ncbi:MAG TPA: YCF48-related protein, partial [Ignavibacteria bacterium]|nr:YCF48-related protein [Ignavibacteria bacterium]
MNFKFKVIFLLVLSVFILDKSYAQQNVNGWYWMNGKPQTATLKWIKIIDATHFYAVGEYGVFMKSSDGGDSWLINSQAGVTENLFESGGSNRINSAWFFDANTGFLATQSNIDDGGKIRKTTDGGDTFSTISLNIGSGFVSVRDIQFLNSNTGFICGSNTMKAMKTTNGGTNWTMLPNLQSYNFTYNCIYAKDEINIFLGVNTGRMIVRTTNAGNSWTIDTLPGTVFNSIQDIEFKDANTGYAGGDPAYFATTTDGGISWTEQVLPNYQMGQNCIKVLGNTVLSLGSYTSIFYSTNSGTTWGSLNFYDPSNPNQNNPFLMYAMDIKGSDVIVAGINGIINVSNDGGASWRNKNYAVGNNQYTYYDVFAENGNGKIWVSGSGLGIFHSTNGGNNWTQQLGNIVGTDLRSIQMTNSSTGYSVGGNQTNGGFAAIKTTNGGASWFYMPSFPTTHQLNKVSFVNPNTGWVFGGIGGFSPQRTLAKTTNGGNTWTLQTNNIGYVGMMVDGDMLDANNGVCVSGGFVFKTTNGGTNWISINSPNTSGEFRQVNMLTPSDIIIGEVHGIYKTVNGGINWIYKPLSNQ